MNSNTTIQGLVVEEKSNQLFADPDTKSSEEKLGRDHKEFDLRERENKLQNFNESLEFSKKVASYIFIFVAAMMGLVFISLFLNKWLNLNTSVLIALLTTTTANILGLLFIVIKYLFHHWLKV